MVSYSVSQQIHYIGVRMALGASPSDILKMVLKQGMVLALLGIGIGVVAALGLMRSVDVVPDHAALRSQDHRHCDVCDRVGDVVAVALLACYLPARRATKVDPLVALRYE